MALTSHVQAALSCFDPFRYRDLPTDSAHQATLAGNGGDECPYIPGKRYLEWNLPDPKGRPLDEVRAIRDDIVRRIDSLLADETLK